MWNKVFRIISHTHTTNCLSLSLMENILHFWKYQLKCLQRSPAYLKMSDIFNLIYIVVFFPPMIRLLKYCLYKLTLWILRKIIICIVLISTELWQVCTENHAGDRKTAAYWSVGRPGLFKLKLLSVRCQRDKKPKLFVLLESWLMLFINVTIALCYWNLTKGI